MRPSRLLLALAGVLALAACADAPTAPVVQGAAALRADAPPDNSMAGGNKRLTLMTRNLYLGAALTPILTAPNPIVMFDRVNSGWQTVQASHPTERMARIADEIVAGNPDLVGLQEAMDYYTQSPGDGFLGSAQAQATTPAYSFLGDLLAALAARGAHYVVASSSSNSDAEMYALPLGQPVGGPAGYDVRIVDHDVILARNDVKTTNAEHAVYAQFVPLPGGYRFVRGWASVDVKHRGEWLRLVDTHLEDAVAAVQVAQGNELIALTDTSSLPVVLVGDLNSTPDGSHTPTYLNMRAAGFSDLWADVGSGAGFTDGGPANSRSDVPLFDKRIDYVLFKGAIQALSADIVGETLADRVLVNGEWLWPSDHAGLVGTLRLTNLRF